MGFREKNWVFLYLPIHLVSIMTNKKIIIIQNTHYHFETTLSLYQMLKNLGLDPQIYRCLNIKDQFNQINFLKKYNVSTIGLDHIDSEMTGMVISAYPNPYVSENNCIPNINDPVFLVLKKLLYISHRFKNIDDYIGNINSNNAICLSSLSEKIGIDYLCLTDIPIKPKYSSLDGGIQLTVQGHFELSGKNASLFTNIVNIANKVKDKKIIINIIGTNTARITEHLLGITISNVEIRTHDCLDEDSFYNIMNNQTDWLLPLITPELNNNTYSLERYSSNFNMATSLRKPIFCHNYFKNIYNIPGIYFNETNLEESLIYCLTVSSQKYNNLLQEFDQLIVKLRNHNETTLIKKIQYLN